MFIHYKDVSVVFRKSKALPFLPPNESLSGLAWDISSDGMRRLSEVDEEGGSIFRNAHDFYRDALKVGSDLDVFTINFLHHLKKEFDQFEAQKMSHDLSLNKWSETMLGTASTSAMMGPALLRDNPDFFRLFGSSNKGLFFLLIEFRGFSRRSIIERGIMYLGLLRIILLMRRECSYGVGTRGPAAC